MTNEGDITGQREHSTFKVMPVSCRFPARLSQEPKDVDFKAAPRRYF
jgi:hypothetical protein